jgi:hypothetical protein
MISPKETFVYYRQILDYIGTNLGKNVQLVQRKTYGEINELFGTKVKLIWLLSVPVLTLMGRRNSALNCWPPPRSKEATTTIPIL